MSLFKSPIDFAQQNIKLLGVLPRRLFPSGRNQRASVGSWLWAMGEVLVFCLLTLALRFWLDPQDPFGIHAHFPWLWIVPAVLAMRYGTPIGVLSVLSMVAAWFIMLKAGWLTYAMLDFPQAYFLGGLILILICGQFSDVWDARTRRLRAVNAYLDERLNTLTKNHFLLRLSHERLEQDLLAKPLTLRETLSKLRSLSLLTPRTADNPLPGAAEFMQVLGQSCQLECAAVYNLTRDGTPNLQPFAELGTPSALDFSDPLLQYSLEQNALAHIQTEALAEERRDASRYLICAPLLSANDEYCGLLTVEKLPFFALNDDTLQLLTVLIGYYADGLSFSGITSEVMDVLPECPPEMALDLVRLHRIRQQAGINSSLVALVFETTPQALSIFEQIKRLKRGVDLTWEISGEKHCALITLLPLASSAAVEGYLIRIEAAIQSQFGVSMRASHVASHTMALGKATPADTLSELVRRCAI